MKRILRMTIAASMMLIFTLLLAGCSLATTTTSSTTSSDTTTSTTSSATTTTTTATTTSATTTTTTNGIVDIEVVANTKPEYHLGTAFDYDSIIVALVKANGQKFPIASSVYTLTGFNSSTPGEITLTVSYLTFSTTFTVTILQPTTDLIIDMLYYQNASGLMGETLLLSLRTIINTGFQGRIYYEANAQLAVSDRDPSNHSNVMLVYSGLSVSGVWDAGLTWNKEHVWPQSLLGASAENPVINIASDIHNLKPANPTWNSSRGNKYYANSTTTTTFAPRDEVKGDVARILFYMVTMYSQLTLVDQYPNDLQMGLLSVLLQWNELDPVDDFERFRNNEIYAYQNNRNPFIDYPEFVALIWDNM